MHLNYLRWFGVFSLVILANGARAGASADPYERVHSLKLGNGLKVVLSPSEQAQTFQIRARVDGGVFNEDPGKAGTAHLLEHYLFTDAKLEPNMTYLEAIKERGGSGNAMTATTETIYYATVPSRLSTWLVDIFGKILFQKSFDQTRVDQAKGPVFLEIGRPNIFDYFTFVLQSVWPDFARSYDAWRTEFDVKEPMYKVSAHRLQTEGLSAEDLRKFYQRVYYPSNITVFVAGNFDETEVLKLLETKFGTEPDRAGSGWVDPQPHARVRDYIRSDVTYNVPRIEIGTKVAGISLEDEVVARIYLQYLSHRLMKDLRNVRGETYTVQNDVDLKKGSGFLTIKFEAPREDYRRILKQVNDMLENETRQGQFTEAMFREARDLYAKGFERMDHDSATMMRLAERVDYIEREYSIRTEHRKDYEVFQKLGYADFAQRLKALFSPNMKVSNLTEPPLFFRFESLLLMIFSFGFWMRFIRFAFSKDFAHDRIRWVRKINYPPAYTLQASALFTVCIVSALIFGAMTWTWLQVDYLQHSFLLSSYLFTVVWIGAVIVSAQLILGAFPRKLMIVNQTVWIKSLGYHSSTFGLDEIESVQTLSPMRLMASPGLWFKIKHRFYYYDLCFWRKGLLIHLKDGRSYFLGVRAADDALFEITSFLTRKLVLVASNPPLDKAS